MIIKRFDGRNLHVIVDGLEFKLVHELIKAIGVDPSRTVKDVLKSTSQALVDEGFLLTAGDIAGTLQTLQLQHSNVADVISQKKCDCANGACDTEHTEATSKPN